MASQLWYFAQGQSIFGPMSTSELQALASAGRLLPDDRVTTDRQTWYFAKAVNGLFPAAKNETPGIKPDETVLHRILANRSSIVPWCAAIVLGCLLAISVGVMIGRSCPKASALGEESGRKGSEKILVAERFELRDSDGKLRGQLSADPNSLSRLELMDENEKRRVGIVASKEMTGIMVSDVDAKPRCIVTVRNGTVPEFALMGTDGKQRATITLIDDFAAVGLADKSGKPRINIAVGADGSPQLSFIDPQQSTRASMGLGADGRPFIGILDQNQLGRFGVGVDPSGTPELSFKDKNGRMRAGISMDATGNTIMFVLDEHGQPIWTSK